MNYEKPIVKFGNGISHIYSSKHFPKTNMLDLKIERYLEIEKPQNSLCFSFIR